MTSSLNMEALKSFAAALQQDPALLFAPELDFMRSALSQYGELKKPAPAAEKSAPTEEKKPAPATAPEPSRAAAAAESSDEEEEEEEAEEEDPDIMPDDPEPYEAVPAGGEGKY